MSSLLLRAAPGASADLFHAVPLDILDPFLYAEVDDRRFCVNGVLERDRIEALGLGIEVVDPFSLGLDTLLERGVGFLDAVFDYAHYVRHVPATLQRLEVIPSA